MNLSDLLDRPIAFHRVFVTLTGSVTAAVFLSQAVYWQKRAKQADGWWYKTCEEWEEETGLTRHEQETARKKCEKYLKSDLRDIPARLYWRVNEDVLLADLLSENPKSSLPESGKQDSRNPVNINRNTETTTETTTQVPPEIKNAGAEWLVAGGVSSEVVMKTLDKERREKEITDTYERAMGYNPLKWYSDKRFASLLKFLMTKTPREIEIFAKWSKDKYSTLKPPKLLQYPHLVEEAWNLAFETQQNTSGRSAPREI